MTDQHLLEKLQQLRKQKKSREFYAKRLKISIEEVERLMQLINTQRVSSEGKSEYTPNFSFAEDCNTGNATCSFASEREIHNLDELIIYGKIDTTKWKIAKYVQNYWGNGANPHWQVKAWLEPLTQEDNFPQQFTDFLSTYSPVVKTVVNTVPVSKIVNQRKNGLLLINKQDAHLNKLDIHGKNNIFERFSAIEEKINVIVTQAGISCQLEKIVFIVGSDEFNSEWTGTTTKGTPQQNILSHEEAFELICNHNANIINQLYKSCANLEVIYVKGNHDEYVGWHMIKWLQALFKDTNIKFDTSQLNRKYIRHHNTALMFNHGDELKASELAYRFPMEFKDEWSKCSHFYGFTGDKHHEKSVDVHGIQFYQIPPLSKAKSRWDDKRGFGINKAEMTAFLIDSEHGMTNIYKEIV